MKVQTLVSVFALSAASVGRAAPAISVDSVTQGATRAVTVSYTLSGEPAVVTLDAVMTNGAPMAAADFLVVSGGANRLLPTGAHTLVWQPPASSGFGPFAAGNVTVSLKAWPTNSPPDYMVIDLVQKERGARYYTSAEAIPGGVTDVRYKTDYLVLRRIPAAGVKWRMGSPSTELGSSGSRAAEATHVVELSEDYYCGVYPTTYRQVYWLNGGQFLVGGNVGAGIQPFNVLNWGWDWPQTDVQYVSYRSWFHDNNCTYLKGLEDAYRDDTYHKFWPRDGHALDAPDTPKCTCKGGGTYTPTLAKFRANYGFMFDFLTDAQWEFACRGGAANGGHAVCDGTDLADTTADANLARFGWCANETSGVLVTATDTIQCRLPQPVGGKLPNGYGLYDMHGLVWEQCLDRWSNPKNTAEVAVDPVGDAKTANIWVSAVMRGGSFCAAAAEARCARRATCGTGALFNENGSPVEKDAHSIYRRSKGFRLWLPCHAAR